MAATDAPGKGSRRMPTLVATGVLSALFCLAFLVGRHNDLVAGQVAPLGWADLLWIPTTLAIWFLAYEAFALADRHLHLARPRPLTRAGVVATFLVILAVWGFYLVIFCPGFIYFDTMNSYWQFTGQIAYSNYHPVLYTALLGALSSLPYPAGMPWPFMFFWLGVVQVVVLDLICTWCVWWLSARGAPRWLRIFTMLFLTANPVVPLFVTLLTSDALFSGFVLLLVPTLYDIATRPGRVVTWHDLPRVLAIGVGVCFMRNNGIYVMLFALACLWLCAARHGGGRARIAGAAAGLGVFWALVLGVIYPAAGIAEVPFAEAVGIPIQQVGAALHDGGEISERDQQVIDDIWTTERLQRTWNPATADGIKYDRSFDDAYLNAHKAEFLRMWAHVAWSNPKTSLKAYLMETQGWWDVGVYRWVRIGAGGWTWSPSYNMVDIDLIGSATGVPAREVADDVLSEGHVECIPFANAAFNVWAVAFAIVFCLREGHTGRRRRVACLAPLVGIWLTLMVASPIFCEFRYVFALCLSWPFLLFLVCKAAPAEDGPARNTRTP